MLERRRGCKSQRSSEPCRHWRPCRHDEVDLVTLAQIAMSTLQECSGFGTSGQVSGKRCAREKLFAFAHRVARGTPSAASACINHCCCSPWRVS